MADPDWNPDTAGRPLAEILREAGIESASRPGRRRRWDDPEETGVRQRRGEPDPAGGPGYSRRRSDAQSGAERPADTGRVGSRRPSPRPPEVEEPALRDTGRGGARRAGHPGDGLRDTGRVGAGRPEFRAAEPSTAAIPGLRPDRKPGVPGATHPSAPLPDNPFLAPEPAPDPVREPVRGRRSREQEHPSTGPIPVVGGADLDEPATPRESALAWLRFGGELLIALAAGIGVYFAATVLWEMLPHLAVFLAPLAVTGLVAGVSLWRQRQGREPVGLPLLAVLVFAGCLLAVAPAAGLLAGT